MNFLKTMGRTLLAWLALAAFSVPAWAQITVTYTPNPYAVTRSATYTNEPFLTGTTTIPSGTVTFSSTTMPVGLVLNPNGTFSGSTCDPNGSFKGLTVTATDGTNTSVTAVQFNITRAPSANACSLSLVVSGGFPTATVGTAYTPNAITTNYAGAGTITYSIVSGSLPDGLTLDPSSGLITGSPTTAGSYTFTVLASDGAGTTGLATFTINVVDAGGTVITTSSLISGSVGSTYSQTIATSGVSPTSFHISSGTLPAGLSLDPLTGEITGTPTTAGSYTFTVSAYDSVDTSGNVLASKVYTLVVSPALGITPTSVTAVASRTFSQTFTASGGTAPYVYSSANLTAGLTLNSATGVVTGRIGTPGTYTFDVLATDVNGFEVSATVTLTVTARPDPTLDPNVIAIQKAQLTASARFAGLQSDSIMSRLEGGRECLKSSAKVALQANTSGQGGNLPLELKSDNCQQLSVWGSVSAAYGNQGDDGYKFRTPAATVGFDRRLGADTVIGAAFGVGTDESKIYGDAAKVNSRFYSLAAYGSTKLSGKVYLDGAVGGMLSSFDTLRSVTGETATLAGQRNGSQMFGKVRVSGTYDAGSLRVTPFASLEHGSGTLKRYSETGDQFLALAYDSADYAYTNTGLGVKVGQRMATAGGVLEPSVKVEYRRTFNSSVDQTMSYVDTPATRYSMKTDAFGRDTSLVTLGLTYTGRSGVASSLGYTFSKGSGNQLTRVLGAQLIIPLD